MTEAKGVVYWVSVRISDIYSRFPTGTNSVSVVWCGPIGILREKLHTHSVD